MCQKWQWWFMHIYVYIQYVHGLWIFKTFNHRSSYWTKTNTLTKCNRTILSTVQVPVTHTYIIYIILNNASILYIAYRASYVWTFTMQYLFVCFCNVVQLVRITRPTESKVAIWAVDVQAISLQQFVILAASFPGKSPGVWSVLSVRQGVIVYRCGTSFCIETGLNMMRFAEVT